MNYWSIAATIWKALPGGLIVAVFGMIAYFEPKSRAPLGFIGGTIALVALWVIVGAWLEDRAEQYRRYGR